MEFNILDIGLFDYQKAWDLQKEIATSVQKQQKDSTLIICEHPTVITIGKNGSEENLTKSEEFYNNNNIQVIFNNRGGDVTLHNPGQLVVYPIFDLNKSKPDLHWFLRTLEQIVIDTVAEFDIKSGRFDSYTGVWLEEQRKICAMGLHCSRWVTSHGLALNVNNDLSEFEFIIPCGIKEKEVTSISKEIGTQVDMLQLKNKIIKNFKKYFN
ncbi:lipoyl(octanoyl) transferase LipB [Candidatus Kapabacteria bacterium]|nr:lipoyl(octanoyl) transferase LipB [Candidatus Kapabacteria bacterium]